ncbi:MAG: 4Fe-4S dicluster domain-containing protein [Candidatus Omnitrophota bacterium]
MQEKTNVFISEENFIKLLESLSREYRVVSPQGTENFMWQETTAATHKPYRAISSIRQFLIPPVEWLSDYFKNDSGSHKPYCIVNAKNCDLASLATHDFVFLGETPDQRYMEMRERNLIISSDCTSFKNVCFCLALDIKPYPEKLFDLNLSPIKNGYLVEIGSTKGRETVTANPALFQEPLDAQMLARQEIRKEVNERLWYHLKSQNLPPKQELHRLIKNGYEHGVWQEESTRCVECGACIMNCPTCHCFLLFDQKKEQGYLRGRVWDGCQLKNFTRVAGGANPLKMRSHRLRNRYIKKFEFFPDIMNAYACTGCGRCIECCSGKIDLRHIFKCLAGTEPIKT